MKFNSRRGSIVLKSNDKPDRPFLSKLWENFEFWVSARVADNCMTWPKGGFHGDSEMPIETET